MFSEHQSGLWGMVDLVHSEPFKGRAVGDFCARTPRSRVSDGWASGREVWRAGAEPASAPHWWARGSWGLSSSPAPPPLCEVGVCPAGPGAALEVEGDSCRQVYFLGDPQPVPPTFTFPAPGLSWRLLLAHREGARRPPLIAPGAQPRGEGLQEGSELVGGAEALRTVPQSLAM